MPAAAVIPAPIAYIKVVAFKKLVVGTFGFAAGPPNSAHWSWAQHFLGASVFLTERVGCPRLLL